ncbi:MAG: peptide ABC transporter substrate-binding protein [Lactobacillales bacterium]|jgi:oligopeptide transport system substrate-binding protein|nr:peptide ABC transporter substrate-binding protein [Lactobacillales bacterium]
MKLKKACGLLGTALLLTSVVAGCGKSASTSSDSNLQDTYSTQFSKDPLSFDYLYSFRQTDFQFLTNFEDGLLENNTLGQLSPALAKEVPTVENGGISEDGLTYTFKLRKGVKWVQSDGEEYSEVKAQDFVYAVKHAVEKEAQTLYLISDTIKGLAEYVDGTDTDFSHVGVKALDDYTVQYTLAEKQPYFLSKFTYAILYPLNEQFAKEKGDDFGALKPESILYNGPYICTNFTSKSTVEMEANSSYWDAKNVHLKNIKFTYNEKPEPQQLFEQFKKGEVTDIPLDENKPYFKSAEKEFKDDIYINPGNSTTFGYVFNYNRTKFDHTDASHDNASTHAALTNANFRRAILFGLDRTTVSSTTYGKQVGGKALRNEFTPPSFVQVDGKDYSTAVEKYAAEAEDGFKGLDLTDGHDAFFDAAKAKEYLEKAKKELGSDVKWPIHLDAAVDNTKEKSINCWKSIKKVLEDALGKDNISIDIQLMDPTTQSNATYYADSPDACDWDFYDAFGWGPDYMDPITYLYTLTPLHGDMLTMIGLQPIGEDKVDPDKAIKDAIGLYTYNDLVTAGNKIVDTDKQNERFDALAKAEAYLISQGLFIPRDCQSSSDAIQLNLSHTVPFTGTYGEAGISDNTRFKYVKVQKDVVTKAQYEKAQKEWTAKRSK